jgi:hypothetical protein
VTDGDNGTTTTTYTTPFGQELDRRNAHLDALPGRIYRDWFDSLNRASKVFSGNSSELERHLTQFVGTPRFVSELPDEFAEEAARLLHNYLAALSTLRDVMRGIHRKVWPERFAPDNRDDKRTQWEVDVWTPKVDQLLGDPPVVFLVDLRNYSLHYAIPMTSTATNFQALHGPGGATVWNNTVSVDRKDLLKWDGWRSKGRQYIKSHDGDNIEILPLLAIYSTRVRAFFKWFWEQIENSNYRDISEFRCKSQEFGYYLKVESTLSQYGPDGRSALRRPLAAARLERAAFGTSGWRTLTRDESGEWVVGEREADWPPLPPGPS